MLTVKLRCLQSSWLMRRKDVLTWIEVASK